MTSNQPDMNMREKILETIDIQDVKMRSRAFFVLKIIGIAVLSIAVLIITLGIGNLLFFTIRLNGHDALLGFGPQGISLFLQTFPWDLFIIDIVLVFLLELLLRQFRFGYRSPMLYMLLAIIALVTLGSGLIDRATPLNDTFLHASDEGRLPPPLGSLYQGSRRPPPPGSDLHRGVIRSITSTTTIISDPDHNSIPTLVILPMGPAGPAAVPGSRPHQQELLSVGETVIVVGHEKGTVIHAVDIHPVDPNDIAPPINAEF